MRSCLATGIAAALMATCLLPASGFAGSSALSVRAAKHALRVNLARGFGIGHVSASCRRRSRAKVTCGWSGRRGRQRYRGRATITRAGGSTVVQLTRVRRI
jgi:hypothetical protein